MFFCRFLGAFAALGAISSQAIAQTGAASGSANHTELPPVEVTTTNAKSTRKAAKPTAQPQPVGPATPPQTFDADLAPSSIAGRAGAVASGSLGTGTTEIDGYVAGATSTATRTSTPIKDIPQSLSVVTRQQAEDRGSDSVGDALLYVPGVAVAQGEGHRDQITIRGQGTTADFYVDGVRDDGEYYRDLYNVDALEVLKGPSALTFGRGGGGGIVNRVTKAADGARVREAVISTGMYDKARSTIDVGDEISADAAFRLNAMYETSEGFRDYFELERFAINPRLAFRPDDRTRVMVGYEFYSDERTVDRGVPSFMGRPSNGPIETFFGNPDASRAEFDGHTLVATIEHRMENGLNIRNHTQFSSFDKVYQNVFAASPVTFPGTCGSASGCVTLDGYRNSTARESFVNQTEVSYRVEMGQGVRHTLLAGSDVVHQVTTSERNTESYGVPGGVQSLSVPFDSPTSFLPVFFDRPSRRWHTEIDSFGIFVQDQLEITRYLEVIGGLRFDRFEVGFDNRLTATSLARTDEVWSHRLGVVLKPLSTASIYVATSTSFLPGAGDQFGNLAGSNNVTGDQVAPEEFQNDEIGFKLELAPRLLLTGAAFRLERSNQLVTTGPGTSAQVGLTRTEGGELALVGYVTDQWQMSLGWGHQIARVVESGTAGTEGHIVPFVPSNIYSLWNRYQALPWLGLGLGVIHQTESFAALNNAVLLPEFTRVDAAVFLDFNATWSAQINIENVLDETYYASAHNNDNISPGTPRSVYATVRARF